MSESQPDYARLHATEAQKRRAFGLTANAQAGSTSTDPTSTTYESNRQRHRFVRDGEVPVTFIRRKHCPVGVPGTNQLDAARQSVQFHSCGRRTF
jgi:hypothetical protein